MTHITLPRAVVEQALEALEAMTKHFGFSRLGSSSLADTMKRGDAHVAMNNLRAALAQQAEPVQEPVVWECKAGGLKRLTQRLYDMRPDSIKRHYTRIQPQRKPLTDEEIDAMWRDAASEEGFTTAQFVRNFARAVERAHGIKE